MRIVVDILNAEMLAPAIWRAKVTPESVRKLSPPLSSAGPASVLLIEDAEYDDAANCLRFPFDRARVLNLGATDTAVFIGAGDAADKLGVQGKALSDSVTEDAGNPGVRLGLGDRDYLRALGQLPPDLQDAAQSIIISIRKRDPSGDLRREGQRFVNRPDNWVTLQPQPRVKELLVTFKGTANTHLKQASARRPYQGFKVRGMPDVDEAIRVLGLARRRFF